MNKLRSDFTAAVKAKDNTFKVLREFLKRVRAGAQAAFGDDSLEYERVGVKRISERKRPTKKNQVAAA